jgi:tRNA (guanine37-N1)-methyltransferase
VLLSGDHAGIRRWRLAQAVARTAVRRPGLLAQSRLAPEARRALEEFRRGGGSAAAAPAGAAADEDRGE